MKLKLKICGMRDPDNIIDVIKFHPDYFGFIFYPGSPRYAGKHIEQIKNVSIPGSIKKVGVFVNEGSDKILQTRELLPFDLVQLHGNETVTLCDRMRKEDLEVIKVFSVDKDFDFGQITPYVDHVDYFLFDTKAKYYGGNSVAFDWKLIDNYPFQVPFFLSGGIGNDNICEIQTIKNPFMIAVDANSKLEISSGHKDLKKVKSFREQFDQINL